MVGAWSLGPVVMAIQALKGVGLVIAATLVAEIGDISRFENPRHLMAYHGLVPGEHSSIGTVRPSGITKTGNSADRAWLLKAGWSYRTTPKVGQWQRQLSYPSSTCSTRTSPGRRSSACTAGTANASPDGKRGNVAITAGARELVGFIWDIARRATPL